MGFWPVVCRIVIVNVNSAMKGRTMGINLSASTRPDQSDGIVHSILISPIALSCLLKLFNRHNRSQFLHIYCANNVVAVVKSYCILAIIANSKD